MPRDPFWLGFMDELEKLSMGSPTVMPSLSQNQLKAPPPILAPKMPGGVKGGQPGRTSLKIKDTLPKT